MKDVDNSMFLLILFLLIFFFCDLELEAIRFTPFKSIYLYNWTKKPKILQYGKFILTIYGGIKIIEKLYILK